MTRGRSGRKRKPRTCGYCGKVAVTSDHIPTRKLFPQPRPADLITVPACQPCNNATSTDEEYFINALLSHHRVMNAASDSVRAERFRVPAKARRVRAARRIIGAARLVDVRTPAGLHAGKAIAFKVETKTLEAVLTRIVRGLYFHEWGQRIPDNATIRHVIDPAPAVLDQGEIRAVLAQGSGRSVGDGVFEYRIVRSTDDPNTGLCVMLFYQAVIVVTYFMRPAAAFL